MTAECLAKIEQMNRNGLNDAIIGEAIGCSAHTVGHWRKKLGLSVVGINRSKKLYTIYDGETTQYIMEGTSKECSEYMGIKPGSFHSCKVRFEQGIYKKYEIYDVKEDDIDDDFDD